MTEHTPMLGYDFIQEEGDDYMEREQKMVKKPTLDMSINFNDDKK